MTFCAHIICFAFRKKKEDKRNKLKIKSDEVKRTFSRYIQEMRGKKEYVRDGVRKFNSAIKHFMFFEQHHQYVEKAKSIEISTFYACVLRVISMVIFCLTTVDCFSEFYKSFSYISSLIISMLNFILLPF